MSELKPCPFCGGDAEIDTMQAYRALATGKIETGIAVYCQSCSAQQMICRGDVPDVTPEEVIEAWNCRPSVSMKEKELASWLEKIVWEAYRKPEQCSYTAILAIHQKLPAILTALSEKK